MGIFITLLLCADDIVLITDYRGYPGGFREDRLWNLGKTKVMGFHTFKRVIRDKRSQTHMSSGFTFTSIGGCFSMREASQDRLCKGYVAGEAMHTSRSPARRASYLSHPS